MYQYQITHGIFVHIFKFYYSSIVPVIKNNIT